MRRPSVAATQDRFQGSSLTTRSWIAAADSLRIVIRENKITSMFRFDGTPVASANLPAWDEGMFVENRLVLSRQTGTRALWVVEADSLDFLWSSHNEPDGLIIR